MDLVSFKQKFDPYLDEFLTSSIHTCAASITDPLLVAFLTHAKDLTLSAGKRIRPYMAYVLASESTYPEAEILKSVLAWEVFHMFALIHDDVMDGGDTRHGVQTAHVFLEEQLSAAKRKGTLPKVAEGQAVLLGDLLFSFAHQAILSIGERGLIPRDCLHVAHMIFSRMSREVIAGQMMDIDFTTRDEVAFPEIEKRNFLKTSSYTFIRPMQFGAAINAGDAKLMQFCTDFGTHTGQAFQLQDDLLDVRGTRTGKTAMRDLREGQHTALTQFVFEHGTAAQQQFLRDHLGVDFSKKDEESLQKLFEESKAFAHVEGLITKSFDKAKDVLDQADISKTSRESFSALLAMLQDRTA